jgi:hypothetical protein
LKYFDVHCSWSLFYYLNFARSSSSGIITEHILKH